MSGETGKGLPVPAASVAKVGGGDERGKGRGGKSHPPKKNPSSQPQQTQAPQKGQSNSQGKTLISSADKSKEVKTETSADGKPSFKSKVAPSVPKKTWKIVVRKLPPTKDFTKEHFEACLQSVLKGLQADPALVTVDHFIVGKISRKRGPVNGAGFIAVQSEALYEQILRECPSKFPFLSEDNMGQPELLPAPFTRSFKSKEKADTKYVNTYLEDPDFLAFQEQANKPEVAPKVEGLMTNHAFLDTGFHPNPAATSAALTAQAMEKRMQQNPLLQFLREKAQSRRRGGGKALAGKVTAILTKANSANQTASDRKEKKKQKRREKEEQRRREKAALLAANPGSNAGDDSASQQARDKLKKKKRDKDKKRKLKRELERAAAASAGGVEGDNASQAASATGGGSAAPSKSALKRAKDEKRRALKKEKKIAAAAAAAAAMATVAGGSETVSVGGGAVGDAADANKPLSKRQQQAARKAAAIARKAAETTAAGGATEELTATANTASTGAAGPPGRGGGGRGGRSRGGGKKESVTSTGGDGPAPTPAPTMKIMRREPPSAPAASAAPQS